MQISVGLTMVLSFVTTNIVSMRAGPVIREMTVVTSVMRKIVQVKLLDQILTHFILMDYPMNIDTISMEKCILYFKGFVSQNFYKMMYFCP